MFAAVAVLLLIWLLVQTEVVQNYIVGKLTHRLSEELKTEVSVQHVSFSLFNKVNLEKTLIRDRGNDTILYAGQLKVRLTDWFFFKEKIVLKYIGLEDAVIKLQRPDTLWNYQFIADYFAGSADTSSQPKKQIAIDFKKIDFKNVSFLSNDHWIGTKQTIKAGSALVDVQQIDFANNKFLINEIVLDRPQFLTEEFDGKRPPRHLRPKQVPDTSETNILLQVESIDITNGTFFNTSLTNGNMEFVGRKPDSYFDGRYILFNKINASLKHVSLVNDTLLANIDLSTSERSGFVVNKLQARMKFTPEIMEFSSLKIVTPKSRIQDYYAMKYSDFNGDMAEYITHILMDARFKNSHVHSDDIAYFAPELSHWKKAFDISGNFLGTVDNFKLQNLLLRNGSGTFLKGALTSKGLPDIDHTVFTLRNGIAQTTYTDIADVFPAVKKLNTPDLPALGTVGFKGNFSGTIYDFYTSGDITTALGNFSTDIKLVLSKHPEYKGSIRSTRFNLGKFIKEPLIGAVTFNGFVEGVGFEKATMTTSISGHVAELAFNNYTYQDIDLNGLFQKSYFNGELKADDDNFNFTSSLEIDFTNEIPRFNILGDLVNADLEKLNFIKHNLVLAGLFDLNFSGRNIDEFSGYAKLLNASLRHDSVSVSFDSLSVYSENGTSVKKLNVLSDDFSVSVEGDFSIMQLPVSLQAFLNRYYPAYIPYPGKYLPKQNFRFNVQTAAFEKYIHLFDSRIGGLNNILISGRVNGSDSSLNVVAKIPLFTYNTYVVEGAEIIADGNLARLDINGEIDNVIIKDSVRFPNTSFTINSHNDVSAVHLTTRANTTLNAAEFNADVTVYNDGLSIDINPSSFVLNDKKWNLQDHGTITLRKSILTASNVVFSSGDQQLSVQSTKENGRPDNTLEIGLQKINLEDFVPFVFIEPRLQGTATGTLEVSNIFDKIKLSANIIAEEFKMNADSIGIVNVQAYYPNNDSKITFSVQSPNNLYSFFAEGSYDVKAPADEAFETVLSLKGANISLVNQYVSGVFSDLNGLAWGDLHIVGNAAAPTITGEVALSKTSLKVNYTNVRYFIDTANVVFENDGIDFGIVELKDRNGNNGYVRGKLYEQGFKNMRYDFEMSSNSILVLETSAGQNPNFYGKAIGRVNMSLKGNEEDIVMMINAQTTDSTHIVLPPSSSRESGEADFIVFYEHGSDEGQAATNTTKTRLNVHLDVIATEIAQVDIILDDLSGDIIKATGNGRLRMDINNGNVRLNGRYNILAGSYDFNFQSFIPKKFILKEGVDNYIEWTGDASDAKINLSAQYTAENISLNDLINNQNIDISGNLKAYKGDVYVIAMLTGKLGSPKIDFRIDFPSTLAFRNDPTFAQFLNKLENDPSEMVKQVTWLIVFKSFAPYGEIRTGIDVKKITLNSISQQISNQINKMVSDLLFKWTGDKSLQFEIGGSLYSSSQLFTSVPSNESSNIDRQRVNLKLNKKLLDGRIIISVGSDLDFYVGNTAAAQTGQLQLLPDVSAEFILTNDKKLRAIIFSKSSLDISKTAIGRRNRQGIGLSYSRDWGKVPPLKRPVPTTSTEKQN